MGAIIEVDRKFLMFDELRFRYALWKEERRLTKLWRKQDKVHQKARARGASSEELARFYADDTYLAQEFEQSKGILLSRHLTREANKLLIPTLPFKEGETYQKSEISNAYFLTPSAAATLRDAIRKEKKERSEIVRLWLGSIAPIISALTGFVGVLIGLLAYLHR